MNRLINWKCYCLETSEKGCEIIDISEIGDLSYAVNKTVVYDGTRDQSIIQSTRMCPHYIKLYKIDVIGIDEESCKLTGGEWVRVGFRQLFECVHIYSDGGKTCKSSTECESSCISNYNGIGYCKGDDSPYGCYRTIEDFKKGKPVLCVD